MSVVPISPLAPMLRKLQHWAPLDATDRAAVLASPHRVRHLGAHQFIIHEAEKTEFSCVLLTGFAVRPKVAGNGGRQIL